MNVHYRVGAMRYPHPLRAWQAAKAMGLTPRLELDPRLDAYLWQRPQASITALEDQRALQIQARGLPIRLMYSGGTDSHSVAHAFARNAVAIRYTLIDYKTLREELLDGTRAVQLKIKRLEDLHQALNLPPPEYEVIEVGKRYMEAHFQPHFFEHGAFYNCNQSFNLNQLSALLPYSKWDPTTTVNVYGIEKPRLYVDRQAVYWQITDTMSMYAYSHEYDSTWFYLDAEAPELIARQCWDVWDYVTRTYPAEQCQAGLHQLQTRTDHYYRWNQVLGRRTNLWWALNSKTIKTFHATFGFDDPRYRHTTHYKEAKQGPWQHYSALFEVLRDLTGTPAITSILSNRFYLSKDI